MSTKKVRFSIGNIDLFAYYTLILFSKIQKFNRVKELSKSNQFRYGVFHVYLERKRKRFFGIACLQKKFVFQSENSTYSAILISKTQKFYWVKELYKSNQTHYGVFHFNLECRSKRIFGIVCLGIKFVFQSEISAYSLFIRLFYFQNYRKFIGSRTCPNQTKHDMEYPMCTQSVKRKEFLSQLVYKKVRFSIGNFDLFGYSIFENIEILSGQGVVQIEPNSVWSIPSVPRA